MGNNTQMPIIDKVAIGRWITNGADAEMIEFADKVAAYIAKEMTASAIRNIYGEIKRIQMKNFGEQERIAFLLLKPKVAYLVKRINKDGATFFKDIFNIAADNVKDEKSYTNFCNFMEAIVAYHKVYSK